MKQTKLLHAVLLASAWLAGSSVLAWDMPAKDENGVCQLGSVNDVEWFADYIDAGNLTAQAVLTADIDYSGELCYVLNSGDMNSDGIPFKQDLSDPNSIPMPVEDRPLVYQVADYYCDGTPKGSVAYSNTDASGVKAFFFGEDDATGIEMVNGQWSKDNVIYNLSGQRLQKMQSGINIVGGKKIIRK